MLLYSECFMKNNLEHKILFFCLLNLLNLADCNGITFINMEFLLWVTFAGHFNPQKSQLIEYQICALKMIPRSAPLGDELNDSVLSLFITSCFRVYIF